MLLSPIIKVKLPVKPLNPSEKAKEESTRLRPYITVITVDYKAGWQAQFHVLQRFRVLPSVRAVFVVFLWQLRYHIPKQNPLNPF